MKDVITPIESSRQFHISRQVALSDTDPAGRLRFDAAARYLQDVAAFDALDADISGIGNWVLKQNNFEILAFPTYGQKLDSKTYLTGSGRAWVERTSIISDKSSGSELIVARALWVLTNLTTGTPISIPQLVYSIYGPLATHHKVSIRNGTRPEVPLGANKLEWQIRFSDQDVLAHLNNATYLETVEEILYQNHIEISHRSQSSCQVTYRESTACNDPAEVFYLLERSKKQVTLDVFFAKGDLVRTDIQIRINAD